MYGSGVLLGAGSQTARSSGPGSSPSPSSSAIVQHEVKSGESAKRPLILDKFGHPTGAMVSLFNANINAFVKDMDPSIGWDGQTKEAK